MARRARYSRRVIPFPSAWTQQFGVHITTAFPPDLGARFRCYERLRPQPSFSAVVELALASDPEFRVHSIGDMDRIVTHEGEYGAWVAIEGRREGTPAARFIGAVFLDEFACALDVIAVIPKHVAVVRQTSIDLLRAATFELTGRPRQFFYVPPIGWHAVMSGTTANWYPLDFPGNLSNISIPPARALALTPHAVVEAVEAEAGAGLSETISSRDELTSSSGVVGTYLRVHGRRAGKTDPLYREIAVFVVAPWVYRMRLETVGGQRLTELREVFRGVAASFKPLPGTEEARLGRAFSRPHSAFDHWAS